MTYAILIQVLLCTSSYQLERQFHSDAWSFLQCHRQPAKRRVQDQQLRRWPTRRRRFPAILENIHQFLNRSKTKSFQLSRCASLQSFKVFERRIFTVSVISLNSIFYLLSCFFFIKTLTWERLFKWYRKLKIYRYFIFTEKNVKTILQRIIRKSFLKINCVFPFLLSFLKALFRKLNFRELF